MAGKIHNLEWFDINKIDLSKTVAMIAARCSGKSVAIKDILYNLKNDPAMSLVFSATDKYTKFYGSIINENFIYEDYNDELIKRVFERQEKVLAKNRLLAKQGKSKYKEGVIVILDDLMSDAGKLFKTKSVKEIVYNGRHLKLLFVIATQYAILLPRDIRSNLDFVFLFKESNMGNRRRLYDNFAGMFKTFQDFEATFDKYTADFGIMVVDNTSASTRLEDRVFHYKANLRRDDFKVGHV